MTLQQSDEADPQAEGSGDRLSQLSEATLRINESLDFESVLQQVVDSARVLTGARYGIIVTRDGAGQPDGYFTSGITEEERGLLKVAPGRLELFGYFGEIREPLRAPDLNRYATLLGLPAFSSLAVEAFLAVPIRHQGEVVGSVFLANGNNGAEFSREDEETLVMFAAQAALVIANARNYREEQRARAGLETLINTSPVGVVVFDARTGEPQSFNREAVRIMEHVQEPGRPPEELLEILTIRRADGREASLAERSIAELLSTGETVRAEELVLSVPDGRSVSVLANVTPMRSEDGEVDAVVAIIQDLTPLEEMERLRAEFLGMVSHELRAPLSSIKGSTDTLLESLNSLDPAETVQFLRIIKSQAERMRDLIGELLDVARIEAGTLSVSPEPVEAAALVDEARSSYLSGGGRDTFSIDLEPDLPRVMADRRRIAQVLNNLLINAARYSQPTSIIEVNVGLDGSHVRVEVVDEGQGVPPDQMPLLFMKFSRVDDGERRTTDSGLGLAICKGIVEAHGGRIWAESPGLGMGTKFTFTLPVADEISPEASTEAPRSPGTSRPASREQARILAVDDDPMTLRYVRDALTKANFVPMVTADPDEALRLVEAERPRLALLDLMLPGSDGIELMRSILDRVDIPVIFLSAYGRDELIARAIEAGAVDYMVKPFSPTELVARVRGALRRRQGSPGEPTGPFVLGDLHIDYAARRVTVAGTPMDLTPTEYELLVALSVNAGQVLSFDTLLDRVWGVGHTGGRASVRTYVKRLRRKLGDAAANPRYIFAEPRVGYRMEKPETASEAEV